MRYIYLFLMLMISASMKAQVKIGDTGIPDANAVLEISATNKGLLLPRVALANTTTATPLSSHVQGMVIYNTTTSGDVSPGFYFNDGTKWVRFAPITDAWNKMGNAGTDATSNFIGTADVQDLIFKTNNTERLRITSNGLLQAGNSSLPGNIGFRFSGNFSGNQASGLGLDPIINALNAGDVLYGIRNNPSFTASSGTPATIYGFMNEIMYGGSATRLYGVAGKVTTTAGVYNKVAGVLGSATKRLNVLTNSDEYFGGHFISTDSTTTLGSINALFGILSESNTSSNSGNNIGQMGGMQSIVRHTKPGGSLGQAIGLQNYLQLYEGNITNAFGVYSRTDITNALVQNVYGVYIDGDPVSTDNYIGFFVQNMTASPNRRAFAYNGLGVNDPVVINANGSVGIGTLTPPVNVKLSVVDGHIQTGSTTKPTITTTGSIGTGGTATLRDATDVAGFVNLNFGSAAWGTGIVATIQFTKTYSIAPVVVLTANDGDAAASVRDLGVYVTTTTTGFNIHFITAVNSGNVQSFTYYVIETTNN